MTGTIDVSFETTPRLTEVQIRQIFDRMGDGSFRNLIADSTCGGGKGAKAPAHIGINVSEPATEDRVIGMEVESEVFLRRELANVGVEIDRLDTATLTK